MSETGERSNVGAVSGEGRTPSPSWPAVSDEHRARWAADLALVRRLSGGDAAAAREFAARMARLPAFLRARNSAFGAPLAEGQLEDLVQDVLVIVWRRLERFTGSSTLETWVFGIAALEFLNALRRHRRRRRREQALPEAYDPAGDEVRDAAPGDPERLRRALRQLPPEDAELLRLKHADGLSFPELARCLELSPSGAKNRYYRILARLREGMTAEEDGDP